MKTSFYKLLAGEFARLGFRPEDLFISITPSNPEDWSFGNGVAQLLDAPRKAESCSD
ncbi:tautomerase/MIF superfamily protein [Synechococcus sp. Minos11]|nr:tautomerase/MIF superfamily protein [Synechococcus sp. Minos11]